MADIITTTSATINHDIIIVFFCYAATPFTSPTPADVDFHMRLESSPAINYSCTAVANTHQSQNHHPNLHVQLCHDRFGGRRPAFGVLFI